MRKEGTDQSHRDFHLQRNVVHRAMQWLVMHNKYYGAKNVCIDGNAFDKLPEDGNLTQLKVIAIDGSVPWIVLHQLAPHLQAALLL